MSTESKFEVLASEYEDHAKELDEEVADYPVDMMQAHIKLAEQLIKHKDCIKVDLIQAYEYDIGLLKSLVEEKFSKKSAHLRQLAIQYANDLKEQNLCTYTVNYLVDVIKTHINFAKQLREHNVCIEENAIRIYEFNINLWKKHLNM